MTQPETTVGQLARLKVFQFGFDRITKGFLGQKGFAAPEAESERSNNNHNVGNHNQSPFFEEITIGFSSMILAARA